MKKNVVIIGPTSSGKTSLALSLCRRFGGQIISADSRQIFKYMDVGTGKVPSGDFGDIRKHDGFWEVGKTRIFGYDLVTPDKYFSAFDFRNFAMSLERRNTNNFVVGGTGFYVNVLLGNIDLAGVSPNENLRTELSRLSMGELYARLYKANGGRAEKIDRNNRIRIMRAIEVEEGKKVETNPKPFFSDKPLIIRLTAAREDLYRRTDEWVELIFSNGLIDETSGLIEMGLGSSRPLRGIVYRTAVEVLLRRIDFKEGIQKVKFDLHAYVRRQETYFRKIDALKLSITDKDFDREVISLVESQ